MKSFLLLVGLSLHVVALRLSGQDHRDAPLKSAKKVLLEVEDAGGEDQRLQAHADASASFNVSVRKLSYVHPDVAASAPSRFQALDDLLWDGHDILGKDSGHQCRMKDMRDGAWLGGGSPPHMCLREYPDIVSSFFYSNGLWPDCPVLSDIWQKLPCPENVVNCHQGKFAYMDIGANIGTCLMQMISRPDVTQAVAFEPNPSNLFYLTSSIKANAAAGNVALFPVALGEEDGTHDIYEEAGNAGNTVLDKPATDRVVPTKVGTVRTVMLDTILGPTFPYVHLMKIDAQGYEMKIFAGAPKLLASGRVNAIKFELASAWLREQGSSPAAYFNFFIGHGYVLSDPGSLAPLTDTALHSTACGSVDVIKDLVAVRISRENKNTAAKQNAIVCSS